MMGSASSHKASAAGRLNSRPYSMARFWLAIAEAVWPARSSRASSGSRAVPMAMPTTPRGSCAMRSA